MENDFNQGDEWILKQIGAREDHLTEDKNSNDKLKK